jgi:hypothetical protein
MPTENPKISAYVPQVVYDRFKQFQEERGLSMSQATVELLVEYFGIDLKSSESTGCLQSRVEMLEHQLLELSQKFSALSAKVNLIQSTGELLTTETNQLPTDNNGFSEPPSNSPSELPEDSAVNFDSENNLSDELLGGSPIGSPEHITQDNHPKSDSSGKLPNNYQEFILFSDSADLLSSLKSNSLQGNLLVRRLDKVNTSTLSNKKGDLSQEDFYNWLQSKDIDSIRWVIVGEGRKARYIPADDNPVEKLQLLQDWLKSNI